VTLEWRPGRDADWILWMGRTVLGEVWQTPCRFYWVSGSDDGYEDTLAEAKRRVESVVRRAA
jgi:hypothetical protein